MFQHYVCLEAFTGGVPLFYEADSSSIVLDVCLARVKKVTLTAVVMDAHANNKNTKWNVIAIITLWHFDFYVKCSCLINISLTI